MKMEKKPFSQNNIIVIPTAIQNRINPSIRFINISPFYNICLELKTMYNCSGLFGVEINEKISYTKSCIANYFKRDTCGND